MTDPGRCETPLAELRRSLGGALLLSLTALALFVAGRLTLVVLLGYPLVVAAAGTWLWALARLVVSLALALRLARSGHTPAAVKDSAVPLLIAASAVGYTAHGLVALTATALSSAS